MQQKTTRKLDLLLAGAAALLCAGPVGGCGAAGGLAAAACGLDLSAAVDSDLGDSHLDALIEAVGRFSAAAATLDDEVRAACNGIASDLGAATADDTETACANAVAAIEDVKVLNPDAQLVVEYVPAVCEVSGSFAAACTASCDVDFDAQITPLTCEGGYLTGTCEGSCSGWCTVEGDVACTGSCSGSCQGSCTATVVALCDGVCRGQCTGACDVYGADGNCAGVCQGTCSGTCEGTIDGTCSGTCAGSCQGSCRSTIEAECQGECTGSCDIDFVEPRCEGGQIEVDAAAECEASCSAQAAYEVECTEPEVAVSFLGEPVDVAQFQALVGTLLDHLHVVLVVQEQASIMFDASVEVASELDDALEAAYGLGSRAVSCFVAAVDAHIEAAASVQVSISVTVDVSASATASVGAQ